MTHFLSVFVSLHYFLVLGALSGDHNSDMHHLTGRGSRSDRTDSFGSQLSTSPQSDQIPHSLDELSRMSENSAQDMDG